MEIIKFCEAYDSGESGRVISNVGGKTVGSA